DQTCFVKNVQPVVWGVQLQSAHKQPGSERSALPYWNLWASDFYGWVEELRAQAAYDMLLDLAKAYWAHSPLGSYLGYDSIPDEDEKEEKTDN
uniref:Uncharacterized protein n=1 Tax=Electrophorus electricus TaxID=8005 RepID=A0A4W4DNV3_ELEEL